MSGVGKEIFAIQPKHNTNGSGSGGGSNNSNSGRDGSSQLQYEIHYEQSNGTNTTNTNNTTNNSYDSIQSYPESEIDEMRHSKDIQLQLYIQEIGLKEQLLAKINAPSNTTTGGSRGGGSDSKTKSSESRTNKARK